VEGGRGERERERAAVSLEDDKSLEAAKVLARAHRDGTKEPRGGWVGAERKNRRPCRAHGRGRGSLVIMERECDGWPKGDGRERSEKPPFSDD
jgi:hypothetical protein